MAVWSEASFREVNDSTRIDADYYEPKYLEVRDKLSWGTPLKEYARSLIHPAEFTRRYSNDGWRVIRTQNVRPLCMDYSSNEVFLDSSIASRIDQNHLNDEDILITRTGANFGQCSLFYSNSVPSIATSHTFILKTNCEIDPAYLALFLNTNHGKLLIDRGMYGSSQPEIAPKFLLRIPVPRFSAKVEADLSANVRRAYTLRHESSAIYTQAQQLLESELGLDKLRFDKPVGYTARFSELELSRRADPEYFDPVAASIVARITEFEHIKLGSSFTVGNGFPWNSKKFLNDNSGEPVVRIRNIRPTHIDIDELTSIEPTYTLKVGFNKANKGDIVVGMDGIKYFYGSLLEGDCYVNQRVAHLKQLPSAKVSPEYATFIINSRIGQAQLLRDMTIATTVGHITNRNIAKLVIPYVSDSFHDQITSLVRTSIDKKRQSKQLLDQTKSRVEQLIEEAVRA